MDSEQLFKACEEESEAFFDGFRCSASTLGSLKRLARLLDVGHNRLMLGLCPRLRCRLALHQSEHVLAVIACRFYKLIENTSFPGPRCSMIPFPHRLGELLARLNAHAVPHQIELPAWPAGSQNPAADQPYISVSTFHWPTKHCNYRRRWQRW